MDGLLQELLDEDPYIRFKPAFAYSYATQLTINGIILSLLLVLLIHLLFTAPSHYALARLNFLLQLSGVLVTLIAVAATIGVILQTGSRETDFWPYMMDFIYVDMPPKRWSTGELVLWYTMEACSSGIVQITHIQFLTLLYPSDLEARLIFGLLGPIALASSATTYTSLSSSPATVRAGLIARNIFNSTLTLLFTSALFIWGLYINRRRAWRTDGGTAAFGAGALVLAVGGTAVNFLEVKVDGLEWLNHLLWGIILWQSWVGWWWWVGAGMGIGEVEELMEKEQRRARRSRARQAKADRLAAKLASRSSTSGGRAGEGEPANAGGAVLRGAVGSASGSSSLGRRMSEIAGGLSRRNRRTRTVDDGEVVESVELADLRSHRSVTAPATPDGSLPLPATTSTTGSPNPTGTNPSSRGGGLPHTLSSGLSSSSTSSSPTLPPPPADLRALASYPYALSVYLLSRLARAHDEAAKARVRTRRSAAGDAGDGAGAAGAGRRGFGLGEFGVEEVREGEGRLREAQWEVRRGRLLSEEDEEDERSTGEVLGSEEVGEQPEGEWVDEEVIQPAPPTRKERRRLAKENAVGQEAQKTNGDRRSSWSWWGPLRNWRLRDRTEYT